MKNTFFFILLFYHGFFSFSQTVIPRFENLGINEGLPHSSVYSILQDKKGFMWFGTADGLCRYDGSVLKTYKYVSHTEGDVVNNFIKGKMQLDTWGNIWYCNGSGIYKWDVMKEQVIKIKAFEKAAFENTDFQAVYLDDKNTFWIFNIIYGIFEYNIVSGNFIRHPFLQKPFISTIALNYATVDGMGNIFLKIGSNETPFIVFNTTSASYSVQFEKDSPHAIFFEKKRKILAYDDKLIYQEEASSKNYVVPKILNGKNISFYSFDGIRDNYGRLWMTARGNGLFYYDENYHRFEQFHHDNSKLKSIPFDLTTCLYIDRNENLWIGIDGGGVAKLDLKEPKFNLFPLSEGDFPVLKDYFTKCIFEDEKERIWFGTHTGGLNIFDPATKELMNYQYKEGKANSLPGNIIGSIIKDFDGNMWIGSSGGISRFYVKEQIFETIPVQDLPPLYPSRNNFVYKMLQLANGDFLAATLLGIIKVQKEKNGKYKGYYFKGNSALISGTTDIVEMPDKTIYATVPGVGLYLLKPEGISYTLVEIFLNGVDLRSVRQDEKNPDYLWIGSGKGLIHFNTIANVTRVWDEKEGMANSYVYGSLEDASGNLWISTNKGLCFFNPKKITFENYSFLDGLQSNEFNTQAFYKSSKGIFYFGGIRGFNWFNPGYECKSRIKPVAAITHIEINDAAYQKDSAYFLHQTITVPHDKNIFSFRFAALDFTRPEANKIHYTLKGWDAGWVVADNRSARYSNLSPGRYTLIVKVSNSEGIWSAEEKLNIIIQAPFWKRTWFSVTMIFLLMAAIIFVTYKVSQIKAKKRLRLLEKKLAIDEERNRISADMHDEIGSGITHIALLSELIQAQHKNVPGLKKDVQQIAISARKLVQNMGEIIWALNPRNDTLENLMAYIREQSQLLFESMDVQFEVQFPDKVGDIKLSNIQRRNLYLVTREALNNVMKHSGASHILLSMENKKDAVCFSVTDNGSGINTLSNKPGSNGLTNMKKRMEDIHGSIDWIPLKKGTTVKYCMPV